MAQASTLYRFRIELSDMDRGCYEKLDLRTAMHPSESEDFLLTRVLAYALRYEEGLEFSKGLCDPDEPAVFLAEPGGAFVKWIDIGNPAPKRLHKASKAAREVWVFTYKDPENLKREAAGEKIHRAAEIQIRSVPGDFLADLTPLLSRDNSWSLMVQDGEISLMIGDETLATQLGTHQLENR